MSNPPLPPAALILADDPLGLVAWANSYLLAPHTAIAIAASLLAGVAGPVGRSPVKAAVRTPGINLAGRQSESVLRMAVGGLISPLISVEKDLIAKLNEFSFAEVDAAIFSPNRKRTAIAVTKLGEPESLELNLADSSALARLALDPRISDQFIRYEALVRPRFILGGHLPRSPIRILLSEFHFGHGLLPGGLESLPSKESKSYHRLDGLIKCFDGSQAIFSGSGKDKRPTIPPESLCMKGLILFSTDEFDWIVTRRRDFLSRALPVASLPVARCLPTVDEHRAWCFQRLFQRVASQTLAARRVHSPVMTPFYSEAAEAKFLAIQREFLRWLNENPQNLRVGSAAALPVTLAWTLLLPAEKADLEDYVLETTFASARQIVEEGRELFRRYDCGTSNKGRLRKACKPHKRSTHRSL